MPDTTIFTVGHSTRSSDEFIALLVAHGVEHLVDVRTIPKSRRHPHFGRESLASSLEANGVGYEWMKELGGLRQPRRDSPNAGWRNTSFRGYADYMQTEEFESAVVALIDRARRKRVAIMCSEAVPWRCHRSLIADALLVRGIRVLDIMSEKKATPRQLTSFARVEGKSVTYPGDSEDLEQGA